MAVLPPIRLTGLSPLVQPQHQHRRHLINFCHPGYSFPANILFKLYAIEPVIEPAHEPAIEPSHDEPTHETTHEPAQEPAHDAVTEHTTDESKRLGVHHETARIACAILANNTWDGYFTANTPDGPAVPLDDPDRILTADKYYFHHPLDPRYPVVADFESWRFPTSGQLPSYWRSLAIPPAQISQSTPTRCCAVTGRHIPLDYAHLVPVSQTAWFERNHMMAFQEQS